VRKPKQEKHAYDAQIALWPSIDPIEEQGGANLYGMVNNDPIYRWDILGLVDGDPKHPLGKCDGSQSCFQNSAILRNYVRSTRIQIENDYMDLYRKLAQAGTGITEDRCYNPNVTNYVDSWNNHRRTLKDHLGYVSTCLTVIEQQRSRGQYGCCDGFFPKQFRWAELFLNRIQNQIPPVLVMPTGLTTTQRVVGKGIVVIGGTAAVIYFSTPP